MIYYANDKYSGVLTAGYTVGQSTLYVSAVPENVPTVIVAAKGTDNETVFKVTGKTTNSLTGVSRLRGANVDLDAQTPLTCLNNEDFINQFGRATGAEVDTGTDDAKIVTPKAIADSKVLRSNEVWDWWQELTALTRVSDTTATLSGNWTDRLQKGDKLWWLSNGSSRWNYIIGVSYSAPNTTITITTGFVSAANDMRFESGHTITEPKFSKAENPQGFPQGFNWTPNVTASGSMTISDLVINSAIFSISGGFLRFNLRISFTTGGIASTTINVPLPLSVASSAHRFNNATTVRDASSGAGTLGYYYCLDNSTLAYRKIDSSNWGLGTGRLVEGIGLYAI